MRRAAGLLARSAAAGAAAAALAGVALRRRPPGGPHRWARVNHRGEPVSLLEGPAVAAGLVLAGAVAPGLPAPLRLAGVVAAAGGGGFGTYDDVAGSGDSRGFKGHLGALRRGEVTSGAVKIVGIGATGLLAGVLLRRRPLDAVLAGGVVAATANLVNLLDLRPGRALKAALLLAAAEARHGGATARAAAVAAGCAVAVLPDDLGERSMLGDAGANALGAVLGVAAAARTSRTGLVARLGVLTALTLASEKVSFTRVIEATPVLRALDAAGRRPRTP
jgi:UDP-GlcNAc:undecaprenyl-phosphate/decaprenyl-phosphate GlcNAc-1-phosphate transferase